MPWTHGINDCYIKKMTEVMDCVHSDVFLEAVTSLGKANFYHVGLGQVDYESLFFLIRGPPLLKMSQNEGKVVNSPNKKY
jgi:hypothetical protein